MANVTPAQLFPGYQFIGATATSVSNGIFIPLAALPALTAAEAAANGDGRELFRGIVEQVTSTVEALPTANKPNKMTATRSNPTGTGANTIKQTYTQNFDLSVNQAQSSLVAEA